MGSCFSKKTNTTALLPETQNSDLKSGNQLLHNTRNDQQAFKKEIFVIRHRPSHEIDRHLDQESEKNPSATSSTGSGARLRTFGSSKEDECDRLSRSNSAGAQKPIRRRRYSRSIRSFDLGFNSNANANNNNNDDGDVVDLYDDDDDDDALNHHHSHRHRHRQPEVVLSSSRQSSSRERRISISPNRRSNSKDRRISISPSRRSESPFSNSVAASGCSTTNRPAKMVSVPATDKSNNGGVQQQVPVKRIHVKRNVSPNLRVFSDHHSQEHENSIRDADHRRRSLIELDNNAVRCAHPRDTKRTRKLSRDLDVNPETVFEQPNPVPSPPSYASLLLEDIHNFHKKNASVATTPPSFALPECVNKACLIMEAVADLNSNTSSMCLDDRWRKQTTIKKDSSGAL